MSSKRKLPKTLSLSSVRSPELKDMVMDDVAEASETMPHFFQNMAKYTLRLVNLHQFPDDFACFLRENLVDEDMEEDLTKAHAVNWCRTVKKLYPLKTRGDGNCLLHAVSLAMWGIHDSSAFLRRLVLVSLVSDGQKGGGRLFRRWKRSRADFNKRALNGGIHFESHEWDAEWQEVITAASDIQKNGSKKYAMFDFLEDIHVFALANILRRPIIILSDSHVRNFSGAAFCANQFSGIYLPILWSHKACVKSPIVLGYANNHFTPLLGMEDSVENTTDIRLSVVPLVTKDQESLNIHFLTEDDEKHVFELLKKYLNVTEINWTHSDASVHFLPCAKLDYKKVESFDLMRDYVSCLQKVFKEQSINRDKYWLNWKDMYDMDPIGKEEKSEKLKSLELYLNEHEQEKIKAGKKDELNTESQEQNILNIATEESQLCAKSRCYHSASPKYFPYCSQHKRKRSHSTTSIESVSPNLTENMGELTIENTPKRNSLNGKQENLNSTSRPCEKIGCSFYGLEAWGYRCSKHRIGAGSLKENSMENNGWHKCRSRDTDCKGQGHSRYKGMCKNCFLKPCDRQNVPRDELTEMEILEMLPGKYIAGKYQAELLHKCKVEGCRQMSTETTLGYCSDHYIVLYRMDVLNIPTEEEVLQYRNEMQTKLKDEELEREHSSPGGTMIQDIGCSKPGCEGIKCKNPEGLCFECHEEGKAKSGRKLERQEEVEESGSEDLIESLGPLSSSYDSDTCSAPGCLNKGKQSYKGLCLNCYFMLSVQNSQTPPKRREGSIQLKPMLSSPSPSKLSAHQCKTVGCNMFGTEPNMGYCSLCFSKYKDILREQDRQQQLHQMSDAERMRLLPLDRTTVYPRDCLACDRPGNPDFRGFCTICAERRGMLRRPGTSNYPIMPRPSNMTATENSAGEATGHVDNRNTTEYNHMMEDVEKSSRTSHLKCKNHLCSNFANLKRNGYCNQCYTNFH